MEALGLLATPQLRLWGGTKSLEVNVRMEKFCRKAQYHRLWEHLEVSEQGRVSFATQADKEGCSTQGFEQARRKAQDEPPLLA